MNKIVAVVVTYNRKKLLQECLEAIEKQDLELNKVIVVDNNSNDGTKEMLLENKYLENEKYIYKKLEKNIGGAGGFYEGMKLAREIKAEWVWIMDDDTIPEKEALRELYDATKKIDTDISFLASTVYGVNGNCMNYTEVSMQEDKEGYLTWHKYLKDGMVRIDGATFVSLLINGRALELVGLPCRDYFIWGDDTEYTKRLTKFYGEAYVIGKSIVIHKRQGNGRLDIVEEQLKNRINLWYYMVRNNLVNANEYQGKRTVMKMIIKYQILNAKILIKSNIKFRFKKITIINRGILHYIFKKYDKKAFDNRLKS